MAQDIQKHGSEDLLTYTYDHNRRYPVSEGTQCACAYWKIGRAAFVGETARRTQAQAEAVAAAVKIYEERWGLLDWGDCQMLITHVSLQVVVELRVEPR